MKTREFTAKERRNEAITRMLNRGSTEDRGKNPGRKEGETRSKRASQDLHRLARSCLDSQFAFSFLSFSSLFLSPALHRSSDSCFAFTPRLRGELFLRLSRKVIHAR